MNKATLWAFVGPRKRINRLWEDKQPESAVPHWATQILLTEEQLNEVQSLRNQGKQAAWVKNKVVEFFEFKPFIE
jgi:hypothetical protein